MHPISELLKSHYSSTFALHGESPQGVDWGTNLEFVRGRHRAILELIESENQFSILDVGCGYGALLETLEARGMKAVYTGIDVVADMIFSAKAR